MTDAEGLHGLPVAVDFAEHGAEDALDRLVAAGAEIGLITDGPLPPVARLQQASTLIVRMGLDDDAAVFGLRTLATAAKEARPDVRVLLLGADIPERLRAYVDGRVEQGPALDRPPASDLVAVSRRGGSSVLLVTLRTVDWPSLRSFAAERAYGTEVVGSAGLTADQVVARHQVQRRRQERLVRHTISRGSTTVMFEVPGFVAPVVVTAETVIYRQPGLMELEQRDVRVNGAAVAGGDATTPPKLPLIEPERISTPPLAITLTDEYRYTLLSRDIVEAGGVYVLRFEPRVDRPGAARGRAWVDGASFALRRLETVQSSLRGAIVSSEQHDLFASFPVGSETVWLPVQTRVYQVYEGAGHRTPIHRTIDTPDYAINPDDFDARLRAAYASPSLMLRETPQGFRYLLRDRAAPAEADRTVAPRAGERIRTAVAGVLIDPNITTPLPFAGVSYVDLNLFNTGAQLNAFFGGTYAQLSWSAPSVLGSRWRAHGRAFGIAARFNDRSFRDGREQYQENITQRPAHVSAGVLRPIGARMRARFEYELDYTSFDRADTTANGFAVPPDALEHGLVVALERESGPLTLRAWWNPARRQHWRAWGNAADVAAFSPDRQTFMRFGASAARTLALGRSVSSRVEAGWMDSRDLDRFSRYSFGAFENRLHGYPTASIRYDRGGVVRSVTSWAARGVRLDGFGDVAAVRDPGFGERLRAYPGIGAAVEAGGPMRTLWSVEWGYGFRARRSDGRLGTQAVRVTVYRTF